MFSQYFIIFLCLLGFCLYRTDSPKGLKNYIIFLMIIFTLQSGLRDFSIGSDTESYVNQYDKVFSTTWDQIFQNFHDVYQNNEGKDAGYPLFQKILSYFLPSARWYLMFVGAFFFTSLGMLMICFLKTRTEVFISAVWYQAMFYSFYSLTGVRQVLATAFAFWAVYSVIKNKHWGYFVGLLIAGSFLHKSVLVMLPTFFLFKDVLKPKLTILASYIVFPFMFAFGRIVCSAMVLISGSDVYLMYSESDYAAQGAQVFATGLIGMSFLTLNKLQAMKKELLNHYLVYMLAIAVVFTPLAWVDPSLMRVTQYFSLFTLFLIPYLYRCFGYNKKSFKIFFILLCLAIVYRHDFPYFISW